MNRAAAFVLIGTCASAFYLTGLIWTIQWVHYPLIEMVSPDQFTKYEAAHTIAITAIVGPVMVAELVTAVAWAVLCPSSFGRATPIIGCDKLDKDHFVDCPIRDIGADTLASPHQGAD